MKIGDQDIRIVSGGTLRIDGGGMFGVVPKPLWEQHCPPDAANRILLDTNCLLIDGPAGLVLVDSGYGSKCSKKVKEIQCLQDGDPLVANLSAMGVQPEEIDVVILTHLHFDHVGGCTYEDDAGRLHPTFPKARHFVQNWEWEDATSGRPEFHGAYFPHEFVGLEESGLLVKIDGDREIVPGIRCRVTGGHTRGHQILYIGDGTELVVYLADLCPFAAHLRSVWTMAYDQFPLQTRMTKPRFLTEIVAHGWPVLFGHDPRIRAAVLAPDEKKEFVVREVLAV